MRDIPSTKAVALLPSPPVAPRPRSDKSPVDSHLRGSIDFFHEVVRSPFSVGALAPTSQRLARAVVRAANVSRCDRIIELGPGAGAITKQIFHAKPAAARVLAIERNAGFVSLLQARFPHLRVIEGCVSQLRGHVASTNFHEVDCIVSALPWTNFSARRQREILEAAADLLVPGGVFATIACLGPNLTSRGRHFRRLLDGVFPEVKTSAATWLNFPPAFVYRCATPPVR